MNTPKSLTRALPVRESSLKEAKRESRRSLRGGRVYRLISKGTVVGRGSSQQWRTLKTPRHGQVSVLRRWSALNTGRPQASFPNSVVTGLNERSVRETNTEEFPKKYLPRSLQNHQLMKSKERMSHSHRHQESYTLNGSQIGIWSTGQDISGCQCDAMRSVV